MAFVNEYIPPIEQETSEFLKKARETLRTGASKFDRWTVDRDNDMVLFRSGGGHDIDSHNRDYWSFIDRKGNYYLITAKLSETEISPEEIAMTRSFSYTCDVHDDIPDGESIARIKDALREYKDWGVISDYQHCQLTLIDARTGKEI